MSKMGSPPDVRPRSRGARSSHTRRRCQPIRAAGGAHREGGQHGAQHRAPAAGPIRVGVIADQTGPLSFVGLANANVARMVDRRHQRQGRPARPAAGAASRGRRDRRRVAAAAAPRSSSSEDRVDVLFGGIYSSTRQAIKGPAVVEGKTLYIYPEQYEGQESDPLIFCTGPVPAQQVDPFIPWLMRETGARTFYLPVGRLHLAARAERARPRGRHGQRRLDRGRGVPPARPHGLRGDGRADRRERRGRRVQHDRAARRDAVLRRAARVRLHEPRRAARLHVLRRELPEHGAGRARRGAVRLPRLLPGRRRPVQPEAARAVRRAVPGRRQVHRRQRLLRPLPRDSGSGPRRSPRPARSTRTT